jgi:heme-degrading monooxygenase HmoA
MEITVSYWKDENSINSWKEQADHQEAQRLGKENWYEDYVIRVAKLERAYSKDM